jgi:AraC family transcriptional activator of tynA and feaB
MPAMVSYGAGLSSRYINDLFQDEDTPLMRYIWQRRLENCRKDLPDPIHAGHRLSDIAFRWGFNDLSHFSRAFKQRFGCSPKAYRQQMKV